ncbi:MAG: RIP metalloprotease RseP [Clostridia bacterium]|nr:RIP metalloprotease RseP [Clostridia bacterium]
MEILQTVLYIVITLLVFGILILAHEAGHFFVAKACKVKINEFSIGMGPAVFKKQGKETLYSIRALPIGGYVQMDGEDGDGTDENSFNKKPYWQRFLVLVTGALMNILLGFILICIINAFSKLMPTTVIAKFDDGAVSAQSGLKENDKILKINNYGVNSYLDITYGLATAGTDPVSVTVERDGETVVLNDVQFPVANDDNVGEYLTLDFMVFGKRPSFLSTIKYSFDWTVSISKSIYSFFGTLFTGQADLNQISGPVGTTTAIGESAKVGLDSLLLVVALISINLGIVNLLPFPALDGGRILFLAIEAVRRKPISQKVEYAVNAAGLILLLALMAVITVKDVIHLF